VPLLDEQLERFLAYLEVEVNASPLTLQSYRHDVVQFLELASLGMARSGKQRITCFAATWPG